MKPRLPFVGVVVVVVEIQVRQACEIQSGNMIASLIFTLSCILSSHVDTLFEFDHLLSNDNLAHDVCPLFFTAGTSVLEVRVLSSGQP